MIKDLQFILAVLAIVSIPYSALVLPLILWFANEIEKNYPDVVNIIPDIGIDPDATIYIAFSINGEFYAGMFRVVDGKWQLIDTVEVEIVPQTDSQAIQ